MIETIRIPRSRIGAVIGPRGATKRRIERRAEVTIEVDSKEGEVTIYSFEDREARLAERKRERERRKSQRGRAKRPEGAKERDRAQAGEAMPTIPPDPPERNAKQVDVAGEVIGSPGAGQERFLVFPNAHPPPQSGQTKREGTDPFLALRAGDVIRAIGRGFSPERAFALFAEEVTLKVLDIRDYVGRSVAQKKVKRGRLIGTGGRTRELIEELAGVALSIQGNTVCIIGEPMEVEVAATACDMILSGVDHASVYTFLERRRKELKIAEMAMR